MTAREKVHNIMELAREKVKFKDITYISEENCYVFPRTKPDTMAVSIFINGFRFVYIVSEPTDTLEDVYRRVMHSKDFVDPIRHILKS